MSQKTIFAYPFGSLLLRHKFSALAAVGDNVKWATEREKELIEIKFGARFLLLQGSSKVSPYLN